MSLTTLYVDFNSYFASVEQQLRPELRGRAVAVAPVNSDAGCCIAVSYEGKRKGVKTGMRVREARELCPEIEIVDSTPGAYVRMHHRLLAAIETCLPIEAVCSIDEVSCRLGWGQKEPAQAAALAKQVKTAIRERVGEFVTCSIGIAPNRFLAKVATDMMKPDGLVLIGREELPNRLYELALRDLPGIGHNMETRLNTKGVFTVQDLCARSEAEMERLWESVVGRRWWRWLRGEDFDDGPTKKRSIGHQHVLAPDKRDEVNARAIGQRLLLKAAARMRGLGYLARRMSVGVSLEPARGWGAQSGPGASGGVGGSGGGWGRGSRWHATVSLGHGCQDSMRMLEEFVRLWAQRPPGRVKLVDVTFGELIAEGAATPSLFEPERKRVKLSKAMDAINTKFGKHAVYTGGIHGVRDTARGGIAFRSIPDLDVVDGVE